MFNETIEDDKQTLNDLKEIIAIADRAYQRTGNEEYFIHMTRLNEMVTALHSKIETSKDYA